MNKNITSSWKNILEIEFEKEYFKKIEEFVENEKNNGKTIYPKDENVFSLFNLVNFEDVRVVILGQDPYHGKNQAHGLSFSVPVGEKVPPSLKNIYKELNSDLNLNIPNNGFLKNWTKQGVFLMNAIMTVNAKEPASHKKAGWENFTDKIIQILSDKRENIVFMLWGNFAKKKKDLIDESKHLILTSAHPSPFSAYNGFFGNKHFSKANKYLLGNTKGEINWQIKDSGSLF